MAVTVARPHRSLTDFFASQPLVTLAEMTRPTASRVTLIAHASTDAVRRARFPGDEPLDRYGQASARERRGTSRQGARCSPRRRCLETATALGLTAITDPGLAPWDLGAWRGRTLAELTASEPNAVACWVQDPHSAPHGGETLTALISRVGQWLDEAASENARTLSVTDPPIMRAALAHILPGGWETFWRVDVSPLDALDIRRSAARWTLRALRPAYPEFAPPDAGTGFQP